MGVGTSDLSGGGATEPATPGSYGARPKGFRLPATTHLGPVHLQVADLARSLEYYTSVLGCRVIEGGNRDAVLGSHGEDRAIVRLHEHRGARPAGRRGRLGLFHFAILLPDRASLGRFVRHLARIRKAAGAADHLVSEALYLQDPDGLGIEVYADRPRSTWARIGQELMISTDPLDLEELAAAGGSQPWSGMPPGTRIGHVHLHVGSIDQAAAYFSESVGFDRMTWRYPGALFLAAGGYHHHLGTNIWAGPDARAPEPDDARLLEWTIELPAKSLADARQSLAAGGYDAADSGGALLTSDPWRTAIRLIGVK